MGQVVHDIPSYKRYLRKLSHYRIFIHNPFRIRRKSSVRCCKVKILEFFARLSNQSQRNRKAEDSQIVQCLINNEIL